MKQQSARSSLCIEVQGGGVSGRLGLKSRLSFGARLAGTAVIVTMAVTFSGEVSGAETPASHPRSMTALSAARILPAPRFLLSAEEVAVALTARGIEASPQQVLMLAQVSSAKADPLLELKSLVRWDDLRTRVEVRCRAGAECLPFFVFLKWPDRQSAEHAVAAFSHARVQDQARASSAASRTLDAQPRSTQSTIAWTAGNAGGETQPPSMRSSAVVLRAGAHATLTIDTGPLHIRVPVFCLEGGSAGQNIRVESQDHKQIYRAEVLDGATLKGTL